MLLANKSICQAGDYLLLWCLVGVNLDAIVPDIVRTAFPASDVELITASRRHWLSVVRLATFRSQGKVR